MYKAILFILFCLSLAVMAKPGEGLSAVDIDAMRLQRQLMDDPVSMSRNVSIDWDSSLDQPGFAERVVVWTVGQLVTGYEIQVAAQCDKLQALLATAIDRGFAQTWVHLSIYLSSYQLCGLKPEVAYHDIIKVTSSRQWHDLEALAAAELGFTVAEAISDEGLNFLKHATKLAEQQTLEPTIAIMVRGYTASILGLQGQHEKSVSLLRELIDDPRMNTLRFQKAAMQFNLGMELLNHADVKDFPEAKASLIKARDLSRILGADYTRASGEAALSSIAFREGNFTESIQYARSAYEIFVRIDNRRWQGIALVRLTQSLMAVKDYAGARQAMEKAGKLLSPQEARGHMRLADYASQIHEAEGHYQLALDAHKKYFELYTKVHEQTSAEEKAKQVAQMELDVAEAKNRELQKTNELQAERLQSTQRLRQFTFALVAALLLISILLFFSIQQTRKARERKQKIRRILDHIDEGIVTLDSQLRIEHDYSHFLQTFLNEHRELSGLDALDVLFARSDLSSEQLSIMREALRVSLGEPALAWELNEGHLLREVPYAGDPPRVAFIHWVPIFDRSGHLQSVLLGIRDISTQRQLEEEVAHSRAHSWDLQKELGEILEAGVSPVRPLISRARSCSQQLAQSVDTRSRSELHAIKGIARGLNLHILSQGTHELESALQIGSDQFTRALGRYSEILQGYENILMMFQMEGVAIQQHKARTLIDVVQPILPGVLRQVEAAGMQMDGLVVSDEVGTWDSRILKVLPDLLMHALTNAADHGYILPAQEGAPRKNPYFMLSASRLKSGKIVIRLRDHGAGLARERIETIARQKQFVPTGDQEIWDVLLLSDVSTAPTVSVTSGRGIGLSAVQSAAHDLQGIVHIRPASDGPGTELVMEFPAA